EEMTKNSGQTLVLSASQGDAGVSMAHAFHGRKGIFSVLLYPSGPIYGLDPACFVTNGGNIIPIQVQGGFDDCQRLITEVIHDRDFSSRYRITSGNAINAGRLLPQAFYYLYAFVKIKKALTRDLIFSVPSGNFGNLIAGLYAWKFGMPVSGFIAAMNINNAFGDFIEGKPFAPRPVIDTVSPALDVSVPANFERFASFYEEAPAVMRNLVYPASINDVRTLQAIAHAWEKYGVLIDPHCAVALAAAEQVAASRNLKDQVHTVVLATGHPAKEAEIIYRVTGEKIKMPANLQMLRKKTEPVAVIKPQLDAFEKAITGSFKKRN
ncbi:MAG: pyridoxal-phosphate dependent enzyme, partial [Treponema sp.]|nr:pyridoxal-phosphate dependent enzyme [Treponema sp.]